MNTSGIFVTLVGVWVLSQVLAGNALVRLGIVDGPLGANAGAELGTGAAGAFLQGVQTVKPRPGG